MPKQPITPLPDNFFTKLAREIKGLPAEEKLDTSQLTPVSWIERHFYLYDTLALITFHERQRRPLHAAFERDSDGWYKYNTVLWSWPKKSAKSSVIAAVCLYILCNKQRASIKLVANDQKQSDSRVGYYLREAIKIAKQKNDPIGDFRITPSGYTIENLSNGARCEMLPIDPSGEAGGNDDLIVYSELHGWKSAAHQKMYAEMALSPTKFGNSQIYVDTYAGYVGESPILEQMYETGVKNGDRLFGDDWEVWENRTARLLAVWVTQHWLPWQQGEQGRAYYDSEAAKLVPSEYDRMHGNQWATSTDSFVPPEWWNACRRALPVMDKYREVVVTMDAGISSDCFGIIATARTGDLVYPVFIRKWQPKRGQKLDFANVDNPDDLNYPEGVLRQLARDYNVIAFGYDPYQLHDLCSRLAQQSVGYFRTFGQGQPRLIADKMFYDLIRDRRYAHDGNADLTEHVANANRKAEGEYLRIVKRAESMKIDLCVTASMGATLAYDLLPE